MPDKDMIQDLIDNPYTWPKRYVVSPTEDDTQKLINNPYKRETIMPSPEELERMAKEQHSEIMQELRKEILQEMDRGKLGGQINPVDIEYLEKDFDEMEMAALKKKFTEKEILILKEEKLRQELNFKNIAAKDPCVITDLDIVKQVFQDIKLTDYKEVIEGKYTVLQFHRQGRNMVLFVFNKGKFQNMDVV